MPAILPSYDQALLRVLDAAVVLPTEVIALEAALGRVLRAPVTADRDQPPFERSAMDGFAVCRDQLQPGQVYAVDGAVNAGGALASFTTPVPAGCVRRIATGAPLPRGCDGVIPIEQAQVTTDADGSERVRFTVMTLDAFANVHRQASDAAAGQVVLPTGLRLTPAGVGIAATMGATKLTVTRRPRVVLLTTGDEVRPPATAADDLRPQQIRNSNGPLLTTTLEALGLELIRHEHVPDEADATQRAAARAADEADLVLTVGGVSVGQRDHLPATWPALGFATVIHGVNIQPGKPVLLARREQAGRVVLVAGLPGNPVSVLMTFHLFVWPVLRKLLGMRDVALPWQQALLASATKTNPKRELFRAARQTADGHVEVLPWHGSGDLMHTAGATGLVRLPLREGVVEAGTLLPWLGLLGA